ncbi:hypothetical protein [Streptomyces catenulae]|uniref:Uncharacterized protein n=1 Tax=Streptomyces catenulae TaxID=66875 RepID=A0ABV2YZ90_9ACTN|nr:hypothetical protein [Streptomyces catenulae]
MTYEPSNLIKEGSWKVGHLAEELANGRGAFERADNAVRVFKHLERITGHLPLLLSRATAVLTETARNPEEAAAAARHAEEAAKAAAVLATHLKEAELAARRARQS